MVQVIAQWQGFMGPSQRTRFVNTAILFLYKKGLKPFLKWMFLLAELKRGTKPLQFDICSKAILIKILTVVVTGTVICVSRGACTRAVSPEVFGYSSSVAVKMGLPCHSTYR